MFEMFSRHASGNVKEAVQYASGAQGKGLCKAQTSRAAFK